MHVTSVHVQEKPFESDKCSRKPDLERHVLAVHAEQKPFSCNFCSYKSSQKGNLERRVSSVHAQEIVNPFSNLVPGGFVFMGCH